MESSDETLRAIAQKSIKEVTYHKRWSSEWVIRLGDGTDESKEKIQRGIDDIWMYTGEMFEQLDSEKQLVQDGILVDVPALISNWFSEIKSTMEEATLEVPDPEDFMQTGGKTGYHTEHLGFILAELQFLPRAYPDAKW